MKCYTDQILSLFMYLRCIIMTITRDFASHFSLLRDAHRISTATLAAIVGLKGNGNFTLLEKGNSYVSMETFIKLSEIFAVEMSWLVRQSPIPYREESMIYFERLIRDYPISENERFISSVPSYYLYPENRKYFFSLQDRANIVFLMHYHRMLTNNYPALLTYKTTLKGRFSLSMQKMLEKIITREYSFRFKDVEKEFEYVNQALASILFDPSRVDIVDEKVVPSRIYIQPVYQVYDFQDGEELRNIWYNRSKSL